MRYLILAPLAVAVGLALVSTGCTGSSKPTAPATNIQKSTQMEMRGGKGPRNAGQNTRTLD
jgi:hypothetical protein